MWLVSNIWFHRRQFDLNIIANSMAVFLILMVDILSDNVVKAIEQQIDSLGLNVTMLQVLNDEDLPDIWFDDFLKDFDLKLGSPYYSVDCDGYSLVRCSSELYEMFQPELWKGEFFSKYDSQKNNNCIVLGYKTADKMGITSIGETVSINGVAFIVKGILQKTEDNLFIDLDNSMYVPEGYDLSGEYASRTYYFVNENRFVNGYLDEMLGKDNYLLMNQGQFKGTMNELTGLIRNVLMFIASVSLLVSLIGMINSMLGSIRDRTYEIGIKKALGAGKTDIYLQFLSETFVIFLAGTVLGIMLIYMFILVINTSGMMELMINWSGCSALLFKLLIAGALCGLYPAYRASRITIMEAIRKM